MALMMPAVTVGFSSDLSKNWNDVHALSFARFTLEAGIRSAEFLHVDDELINQFDEALQMLPDYPTFGSGNDRVVVNVEGVEPLVCNIPVPVFPVFPCEQVTCFSTEEQKLLFKRTIEKLQSNGNNDAMILCHARARLSMPGTYEYVVNSFRNRQRPNGILTLNVLGERWQRYNNHGHEEAASHDAIVIGRRGEHASWSGVLLGSVVEEVVRGCAKPGLVTPKELQPVTRILAACDRSRTANRALALAATFAGGADLPLVVVCVSVEDREGRSTLEEAESCLEPHHLKLKTVLESGNPVDGIIQVAQREACDLIIMGAFGHSRVRELFVGSTTDGIVRKAEVPVLLYR